MLNKSQILSVLPHGESMCLLDSVVHCSQQSIIAVSRSHLAATHPLKVDNKLHTICCVEYAAQAAAVHNALSSAQSCTPKGVLAKVDQVQLLVEYLDSQMGELSIKACYKLGSESMLKYTFSLHSGELLLAKGQILLAINEE